MTPPANRTYHTKFVFSLAPILPDLEDDARTIARNLRASAVDVKVNEIIEAWVMYQLERHLHLNLEMSPQRVEAHQLSRLLPASFLQNHIPLRDLLIGQIEPVLVRSGQCPYVERYCRVEIRLPDLRLNFL